jgi:hypothetical protein
MSCGNGSDPCFAMVGIARGNIVARLQRPHFRSRAKGREGTQRGVAFDRAHAEVRNQMKGRVGVSACGRKTRLRSTEKVGRRFCKRKRVLVSRLRVKETTNERRTGITTEAQRGDPATHCSSGRDGLRAVRLIAWSLNKEKNGTARRSCLAEKRTPERRIYLGNFAIISGNWQPAQLVASARQKSSKI